jgi:arabinofuranosyltransferase
VLYGTVFFKNAWVSDDAYILFRSVEQLLTGHGLRWNAFERVQAFTCPLWYGLLAAMGSIYRDHYLNSILLSALCNGLLLWNLHKILRDVRLWLLAVVTLTLSQAYFDFTTSGLENPLVYCLLSFVMRFYLDEMLPTKKRLLFLGIATGLLLITRHDAALFVLPLLIHCTLENKKNSMSMLLIAGLPSLLWTAFALIYYGFPFPNTAYAKLGDVMPRELLLQRGFTYFETSILRDFISIAILLAGVLTGLLSRHSRLRVITVGIVLHLLYVLWIGGDFMRGRFFGWDILLCIIVLLHYPPASHTGRVRTQKIITTIGFCIVATISTFLWTPPLATPIHWGAEPFRMGDSADGVTQERYFFFWFTRFTRYLQHGPSLIEDFGWCQDGLEQQRQNIPVAASNTVGMHGYCVGTEKTVVDLLGITDPLLARMPHNPAQKNWRAGHFLRLVPEGYCDSVLQEKNLIADPVIAHYYDTLRLITQSEPLFSRERLRAIWQINTGALNDELAVVHQHLLQQFKQATADGKYLPATQNSCPFVVLPPEVIDRLHHPTP